jgi:hypothetical protein
MERGYRRGLGLAGAAVLAVGAVSWQPLSADAVPPTPLILSAQADTERGSLTIRGRNLGSVATPPLVTLGGAVLVVREVSAEAVVADLPPRVAAGSHLLMVGQGPLGKNPDRFSANIPSGELVTPAGIRIESSGSDVLIVAGDSRITVDPAGGVTIEGAGAVSVRAGGTLSLRGSTVTLRSDTSLSLIAPVINLN